MSFRLLEISTYGWNGISICNIETDWSCRSLLHIEYTMGVWKLGILYFNFTL
jgi:hypothetical protein